MKTATIVIEVDPTLDRPLRNVFVLINDVCPLYSQNAKECDLYNHDVGGSGGMRELYKERVLRPLLEVKKRRPYDPNVLMAYLEQNSRIFVAQEFHIDYSLITSMVRDGRTFQKPLV